MPSNYSACKKRAKYICGYFLVSACLLFVKCACEGRRTHIPEPDHPENAYVLEYILDGATHGIGRFSETINLPEGYEAGEPVTHVLPHLHNHIAYKQYYAFKKWKMVMQIEQTDDLLNLSPTGGYSRDTTFEYYKSGQKIEINRSYYLYPVWERSYHIHVNYCSDQGVVTDPRKYSIAEIIEVNESIAAPLQEKPGYHFLGWRDRSYRWVDSGQIIAGTEHINLTPVFIKDYVVYSSRFVDGGVCPVDTMRYSMGDTVWVKKNPGGIYYLDQGCIFAGWTSDKLKQFSYDVDTTIVKIKLRKEPTDTSDLSWMLPEFYDTSAVDQYLILPNPRDNRFGLHLYARWVQPTLVYNFYTNSTANDYAKWSKRWNRSQSLENLYPGFDLKRYSQGTSVKVKNGSHLAIPDLYSSNKFIYVADSWNTRKDGSGTSYPITGGTPILMNQSTVLHVQWKLNMRYKISYFGNGATHGDVPYDNTQYVNGEAVFLCGNRGNLVNGSMRFIGWNTRADGSGTAYIYNNRLNRCDPSLVIKSSNVELYAIWAN